jgi:CheY-like chemotaxis protein
MSSAPHKWSYVFDEPTRILVVDDDPIQREFASVYLSAPLCAVDMVGDAEAALDILTRERFDIVLVDIEMPGMNGIELVERMRAQDNLRKIPIVMATSHEDIVSIDRAYTAGATSFANKPINWRQFSYQLRNIIRATRAGNVGLQRADGHQADATGRLRFPFGDEIAASFSAIIDAAKRLAAEHGLEADADLRAIVADAQSSLQKLLPEPARATHAPGPTQSADDAPGSENCAKKAS